MTPLKPRRDFAETKNPGKAPPAPLKTVVLIDAGAALSEREEVFQIARAAAVAAFELGAENISFIGSARIGRVDMSNRANLVAGLEKEGLHLGHKSNMTDTVENLARDASPLRVIVVQREPAPLDSVLESPKAFGGLLLAKNRKATIDFIQVGGDPIRLESAVEGMAPYAQGPLPTVTRIENTEGIRAEMSRILEAHAAPPDRKKTRKSELSR